MSSQAKDSNPLVALADKLGAALIWTFHAVQDSEATSPTSSIPYTTIRHTHAWVYYQGVHTTVPISVLGAAPLSDDRRIALQRRGWRTGLLGWSLGSLLGGSPLSSIPPGSPEPTPQPHPEPVLIDVTPTTTHPWDPSTLKSTAPKIEHDIHRILASPHCPPTHRPLETDFIHIPVSSGDGYFRLVILPPSTATPIATTASFRIGSLSLSSAHPRGASPIMLLPELILKSLSVATSTAAWASFYAAFPVLKAVYALPGTKSWGGWALNKLYAAVGGENIERQLRERYRLEEKKEKIEQIVYGQIPFSSMGVRTLCDLEEDAKIGKDGVCYKHGV